MLRGIPDLWRKRPPEIREAPYGDWAIHCQPRSAASAANPADDSSAVRYPTAAGPAIEPRWPTTRRPTRPRTATTPSSGAPIATRSRAAAPADRPARETVPPGPDPDGGLVRLYGIHTVRAALDNPRRKIRRMLVTRNAMERLGIADLDRPALCGRAGRAAPDRPRHRQRRRAPGRRHRGRAAAGPSGCRRSATRSSCWCSTR